MASSSVAATVTTTAAATDAGAAIAYGCTSLMGVGEARFSAFMRLPRLLALPRLLISLETWETKNIVDGTLNPTLVRLTKLAVSMFVCAHLAGCGYFFLSFYEACPEVSEWVVPLYIRQSSLAVQYVHALFWGFSAMQGGGSQGTPHTTLEHVFTLSVLMIGVSMYATLIGNLSGIITEMNSRSETFRKRIADISAFMSDYHIPVELQDRVKSCFVFLGGMDNISGADDPNGDCTINGALVKAGDGEADGAPSTTNKKPAKRSRGREGWEVLQHLPHYLRNEVLCHVNGEIMQKVPIFRDCSEGFMRSLVPLLVPDVVIPGDYIIRAGEIGREMYLVRSGQLEVISHGAVVATLSDGSYVGEVAIIFEQKRTASVRAVTFCDIMVLSKEDFDSVVSQYPEVQRVCDAASLLSIRCEMLTSCSVFRFVGI